MESYERGQEHTLYANFLTLEDKEATTVTDAKITIRHINSSNVVVTDVNEAALTFAVETMYYYKWDVPDDADLTEYTIEYSAIVDGEYAEANEQLRIIDSSTGTPGTLYTSKTKVAKYLGVDADKIEDDWVEWATYYIDLYVNGIFREKTVTEKYDINKSGQSVLFLDHFPIISVNELKNYGEVMAAEDYVIYNEEGIIKLADDFIGNIYNVGAFYYGRQKVEVTYKYGRSSVPDEIEWAATIIAAQIAFTSLVNSGEIKFGNITEETIGQYSYKEGNQSSIKDDVYEAQRVADRLEEDVFSAKNVLRIYRTRKMEAV
jgi:hypothetical protein